MHIKANCENNTQNKANLLNFFEALCCSLLVQARASPRLTCSVAVERLFHLGYFDSMCCRGPLFASHTQLRTQSPTYLPTECSPYWDTILHSMIVTSKQLRSAPYRRQCLGMSRPTPATTSTTTTQHYDDLAVARVCLSVFAG